MKRGKLFIIIIAILSCCSACSNTIPDMTPTSSTAQLCVVSSISGWSAEANWYEDNSWDSNYDELPVLIVSDPDTLFFSVNWDCDTLTVGEDYYTYPSEGACLIDKETYELEKNNDGLFALEIQRRNSICDEQAIFYIENDAGIFVIKVLVPETMSAPGIPSDVAQLFSDYGWTAAEFVGSAEADLPDSLMTNVEDSPMQFYWMRAVILSGDVGYDLISNLGSHVKIEIYYLTGNLPEKYKFPVFQSIRGIVYRDGDGLIVGSLIDSGRHSGNSISLSGNDIEDITGMSLSDYWYENYYDISDPVNIDAGKRTADEVIRRYLQGVATEDTAMQLSTLCVQIKLQSLFTNMDDSLPFNTTPELFQYLSSVNIISINEYHTESDTGITDYAVDIDAKTGESGKMVLGDDGTITRFILVGDENGTLRIFGDGTGP